MKTNKAAVESAFSTWSELHDEPARIDEMETNLANMSIDEAVKTSATIAGHRATYEARLAQAEKGSWDALVVMAKQLHSERENALQTAQNAFETARQKWCKAVDLPQDFAAACFRFSGTAAAMFDQLEGAHAIPKIQCEPGRKLLWQTYRVNRVERLREVSPGDRLFPEVFQSVSGEGLQSVPELLQQLG